MVRHFGGRVVDPDVIDTNSVPFVQFAEWGRLAALEIGAQWYHVVNFGRSSVQEWAYPGDLGPLREAFGSSLALFVVFRDARQTKWHKAGEVLGGVHSYYRQVAIACLTRLDDGRMVYCQVRSDEGADWRESENAQWSVRDLLKDLYGVKSLVVRPREARPPAPRSSTPGNAAGDGRATETRPPAQR